MEADGRHPEKNLLVHVSALRDLLDATGLFLGEASGEAEVSVRTLAGHLPSPGVLDALARFAFAPAPAETVHMERAGGFPVLLAAGPGRDRRSLLAAVFPLLSTDPAPWQRELFGYVAQKLIASLAMEVVVLAPSAQAPALVIPPGMVVGGSSAIQALLAQVRSTVRSGMDVLLTLSLIHI